MGYRTTIKNINSVGHLIEGNVYTFLQQSMSSDETLKINYKLIDKLIRKTNENFYMSEPYWGELSGDLRYLNHEWERIRDEWQQAREHFVNSRRRMIDLKSTEFFDQFINQNEGLLDYFQRISRLFSRCKVKSILLPGFDNNPINSLLTREDVLKRIVRIHPGDTALILQFEERFGKEDKSILNVFSKFDKALYQIDNWPGVFLWNKEDSLFLPVRQEEELYEIFRVIKYEDNSFNFLRDRFEAKAKRKKLAYIFHLSDLHFGNKIAEKRTMRIVRILEDHISKLEEESAKIIPVITGDLMQSPNGTNKQAYLQFSELLESKGFEKPIHILGNHDVDESGIFKLLSNQKSIIAALSSTKKIELFEDLKLGIIKFDSNTGGELAQGKIGEDQLMDIGNELDAIRDKDQYTFIAILHHHPIEVENPEWYARDWYESLLGSKKFEVTMRLIDADLFLEWIEQRGIKYVLHGHKHIPKIQKHKDVTIIAAGSTSGSVKHQEKGKTYLTYNLIKYDIEIKQPISCSIVAEEIIGAGTKNMLLHLI